MGWFAEAVARANERTVAAGRWRSIRTLHDGGPHTRLALDGREVVQFASNDYFGLATHPATAAAAAAAATATGTGSGASRLIVGSRPVHDELEAELAAAWGPLFGGDCRALLFPTGFAANLGVVTATAAAAMAAAVAAASAAAAADPVGGAGAVTLLSDELNHASIIDGARLSKASIEVFPHTDLTALATALDRTAGPAIVVSDQVFSMDGDLADAVGLAGLCAAHDALLVLDVAHDVFGSLRAVAADVVATGADVVVVGTSSKALGSLGGWVVAPGAAIDLLVNTARPFIFSTAPTPADTAAALAALRILEGPEGTALRARLRHNVDRLVPGHPSPIVPVVLGSEDRAMTVSAALLERGLLVPAIRPPTVPDGTCRLRVALSSTHSDADIDRLLDAFEALGVDPRPQVNRAGT